MYDVSYSGSIVTTESLTAGLVFSQLVDIPFGGWLKYGCFGVYDTDAKRIFNGVSVEDVYTHECAKQMALGALSNSNATIAMAVTGNAMPVKTHENSLGIVHFGVATYTDKGVEVWTKELNVCDTDSCQLWKSVPGYEHMISNILDMNARKILPKFTHDGFNEFQNTSVISKYIRLATAYEIYKLALELISSIQYTVPDFIKEDRVSESKLNTLDETRPNNKLLTDHNMGKVIYRKL